jgi:hypothetical protein
MAFFDRLLEINGLAPCHIRTTARERRKSGGNTRFGSRLRGLRVVPGFSGISDILLVTDNDRNWRTSFDNVCRQIVDAGFGPPPAEPLVKGTGHPAITIMMIPTDRQPGNLESACKEAARSQDDATAQNVDKFLALCHEENMAATRSGQIWLRTNLAARARDPFVWLRSVFQKPTEYYLIPLEHISFRPLVDALRLFAPPPPSGPNVSANQRGRRRTQDRPKTLMRRPGGQSR